MTAPAAIIDQDLSPWGDNYLYVIESDAIWRTLDLATAGAATWEKVYDAASFEDADGLTFLRIKCAPTQEGIIYALAYAESEAAGKADCYVFRSSSFGVTWTYALVREEAADYKDYTVTVRALHYEGPALGGTQTITLTHARAGDDVAGTYNPYAMAFYYTATNSKFGWGYAAATATTIHNFSSAGKAASQVNGARNALMGAAELAIAQAWLDEYFGAWTSIGGVANFMPKDAARVLAKFTSDPNDNAQPQIVDMISYVFWNVPSLDAPRAFDVAYMNNNWLYVGFDDAIYQSTDGGFTWAEWLGTDGADDIAVYPNLPGILLFWTPSGDLKLAMNGAENSTLISGATPARVPYRIAIDPPGAVRVWVLEGTAPDLFDLKKRESGSWSTQVSDVFSGRGLIVYAGGMLMYMDGSRIWYSSNYGAGWAQKEGAWSVVNPVRVQLLSG